MKANVIRKKALHMRSAICRFLVFGAAMSSLLAADSATCFFTGGGAVTSDGAYLWSDPQNWGGMLPTEADAARFPVLSGVDAYVVDLAGQTNDIAAIEFNGGPKCKVTNGMVRLSLGKVSGIVPEGYGLYCNAEQRVDGAWKSGGSWGSSLRIFGDVYGDGEVTSPGSQNDNLQFYGSEIYISKLQASCMGITVFPGTHLHGTTACVNSMFVSGEHGSKFAIDCTRYADGVQSSEFGVFKNGAGVGFAGSGGVLEYKFPTVPVEEKFWVSLSGGRGRISVSGATEPNSYLTITNLTRSPGTYLHLSQSFSKTLPMTPVDGQGLRITGAANNQAGVYAYWMYGAEYMMSRVIDAAGTIDDGDVNDYVTEFPVDGGSPWMLARQTRDESLVGNLSLYHLFDKSSGDRAIELNDHDLKIYGNITYATWGMKTIAASGRGRLVFANDDIFILTTGSGCLEISAPIAWEKPSGSEALYPNIVCPFTKTDGVVFSGRDDIGHYGNINLGRSGSANGVLVFDGPSNREIHGELQDCVVVKKRGSGNLTFSGPARTRSCQVYVENGMAVIANDEAPAIESVTNGAIVRVNQNVSWTRFAKVYKDGILEGSGTILTGHTHDNLFDGCILRGGTAKQPGTLTFSNAQVTFPSEVVLDIGFSGDGHGQIIAGKQTFKSAVDTVVRVRLSDVDGTASVRLSDVNTIYSWTGSTENYSASRISFVVENATPLRLDTSHAVVSVDTNAKMITVTGIRSKHGMVLFVR
jgi:hypothetical protein